MKALIIYGSTRGNTRLVAARMPGNLHFDVDVRDVASLQDSNVLRQYDLLLFLASTWGDAELQIDMEHFFARQRVDLCGKHFAICELGNYYGYDDFEFGALRIMQHQLEQWGGREFAEPFCMDSLPRKDWDGFARWCEMLNRAVELRCTT
jgi:flavodoxin